MSRYTKACFPHWVGFEIDSLDSGRCVMSLDVRREHLQVHGVLHGGATAALADTAVAFAVFTLIEAGQDTTTIEIKVNYLRPIPMGRVIADARIIRLGQTIAVGEVDVYDHQHQLAAKAIATYMVYEANDRNSKAATSHER